MRRDRVTAGTQTERIARAPAGLAAALAAVVVGAPLAGCAGGAEPRGRSCVLVTLDTTRRDALGAWGGPRAATPNLDALAAESLVHDAAFTVAPITQPAHASILTGLYPPRHGVRANGLGTLPASAHTLAEAARAAGLRSAAFVGAVVLDPSFGLEQGFETYSAPGRAGTSVDSHVDDRPAGEVVDEALAWLATVGAEEPFFLWVHVFDPHGPYAPPERFRLGSARKTLYYGEVAYADRELGRLLRALRERPGGTPFLAVVSDHGEAFGEHGEETHGTLCWDTTLRVPLLLRFPDGWRAGERSDEVVSVVDLYPTLLEAMGLPVPDSVRGGRGARGGGRGGGGGIDGRSLFRRPAGGDRGVYFESYNGWIAHGWSPLAGWIDAEAKYVHSSAPELYAWRSDPGETRNLLEGDAAADAARYRAAIADVAARTALEPDGEAAPAVAHDLQRLGYAAAGAAPRELPEPLEPVPRPSPHAMADVLRDALRAQELTNQGQPGEAEVMLRSVLARSPESPFAHDRLATALILQGRHAEAIPHLRRVVGDGPQWPGSWFNLGISLLETGDDEEALAALRRAARLQPDQPLFRDVLADVEAELGENREDP